MDIPGITVSLTAYDPGPQGRIIPGIIAVRKIGSLTNRDLGLREAKNLTEQVRDGYASVDSFRFNSVEGARIAAAYLRDHGFTAAVHQVVTRRILLDPREAD